MTVCECSLVTTDIYVLQFKLLLKKFNSAIIHCYEFLQYCYEINLIYKVFVNVQKHPVAQVLLVKFVCQVVLQRSKAREWSLCLKLVLPSSLQPLQSRTVRASLTSRTVSKVSGKKRGDIFFNSFSSVTRASTSMSSCNFRYRNAKTSKAYITSSL